MLFRSPDRSTAPRAAAVADYPPAGKLKLEKELLGFYLSDHPLRQLSSSVRMLSPIALAALEEHKPDIIGMSALLTTTMPYMKVVIDTMKEKGIRDDYIVLVGGAPLNEDFARQVGADAYCRDAAVAVETAKDFIRRRHNQRGLAA